VSNRLFVAGTNGDVYCVDATKGETVWTNKLDKVGGINSSPVVVGKSVVLLAGTLTAFDVETGEVKWRQKDVKGSNNSPSAWAQNGKQYVVCNTRKMVFCVNAEDGKVVWTVKGGGHSSSAISGNHLVVLTKAGKKEKTGFLCYEVSPTEAKELWKAPPSDGYSSPIIHGEYAYATGGGQAVCVELKTGKIMWEQKIGAGTCSSPLIAGGMLITLGKGGVVAAKVSPQECKVIGTLKCGAMKYGSPSFADGRLFLRQNKSVACYNFARQKAE
jgi:outer membrane protein assembly factor BamB